MAKAFTARGGERDSAFAQFDQLQAGIAEALVQLPDSDAVAQELQSRLARFDATAREAYAKAYGGDVLQRVKDAFDWHQSEFEGWRDEAGAVTAEEYLKIDCTTNSLAHPRNASLVNRSNAWLAFVGADAEFQRAAGDARLQSLRATVQKDRDVALERLLTVATGLVAEIEKAGLSDEVQRNRAAVLADWDLRLLLQEHPRQWELVARLHTLVDAFDRKALGDEAALAKLREEALKSVDSHWTRMQQSVPQMGGFVAEQAGKFAGRCVRLEQLRDHADEFVSGDFDLVFRIDGHAFAARHDPAVKAALAAAMARTKMHPSPQTEHEILAIVGPEGTLTLPAADPKEPGVAVPCRHLTIVGIRTGPIAFLAR
jgi:hypothetical protein